VVAQSSVFTEKGAGGPDEKGKATQGTAVFAWLPGASCPGPVSSLFLTKKQHTFEQGREKETGYRILGRA
jgi:hypothetical protein